MKYFLFICIFMATINPTVKGQVRVIMQVADTLTIQQKLGLQEYVTIHSVHVSGNKKTRRNIIMRELNMGELQFVRADSLDVLIDIDRKRLLNLSLFTDVIIEVQKINDSTVDWQIKLKEQWYLLPEVAFQLADRNFNVWWTEQNHDIRRANIRLTLKDRNFRGNMESLSATVQVGYTQRFALEYYKPYLDKEQKHGFGVGFSAAKNEETFFKTDSNKLEFVKTKGSYIIRQFEGSLLYVYRPAYADKHTFELKYRDYEVDDTIASLNPDYYENSTKLRAFDINYRYELNKVDNWNYPMIGHKTVTNVSLRFGLEGFRFQSSVTSEIGYFKKLAKKLYLAEILRGKVSLPEDVPYSFRSAMGVGSEYLRGYEYYVVDGSQYGLLRTNLKYELLNITIRNLPLKYLPVIPVRIYPKLFTDVGYARNRYPGNSILNNRWLYSYGVGVDIVAAYDFKLRLEYAWNHLGEKGLFLHLNSE